MSSDSVAEHAARDETAKIATNEATKNLINFFIPPRVY
jgi:hypothetical protein